MQVNNAGIAKGPNSSFAKISELPVEDAVNSFSTIYNTNVFAVVTVTNIFLPLLQAAPSPRIVNVSSSLGSLGRGNIISEYAPYSTSKSALNAVTLHYAKDLENTKVKINMICPGYCGTDLNDFAGPRSAAQGAAIVLKMATIPDDGPHGGYFEDAGKLPW